jgi:hypothetical protein
VEENINDVVPVVFVCRGLGGEATLRQRWADRGVREQQETQEEMGKVDIV